MRSKLVVVALSLILGGFVAGPAHAQGVQATGPICFSTLPFPDILCGSLPRMARPRTTCSSTATEKTSQETGRRTGTAALPDPLHGAGH